MMNKVIIGIAVCGASILGLSAPTFAGGPPTGAIDGNDKTFACFEEADPDLPEGHCINVRSQGNTGLIIVLSEFDDRWPAEGISFDPKSNDRPCPQEPDQDGGTWWTPPNTEGVWVCHRKP